MPPQVPRGPTVLGFVFVTLLLLLAYSLSTTWLTPSATHDDALFQQPLDSGSSKLTSDLTLGTGRNPADPVTEYGDYAFLPPELASYFPAPDAGRKKYQEWNSQSLRELYVCMSLKTCGSNQKKVALLAAHWFEEAIVRGWRGGEGVWGLSVYKQLKAMGYTTLFANSFEETLSQYRLFPSLVAAVIRNKAGECHSDPKCVMSKENPTGIPAWKIFDFEYFPSKGGHFHASLMKGKWILSAQPERHSSGAYNDSTVQYIGFSIEEACRRQPPIPLENRHNRIFMLMKQLTYVYDKHFAWNRTYFSSASSELNMPFVGSWFVDQGYQWDEKKDGTMVDIADPDKGVINLLGANSTKGNSSLGFGPDRWREEVRMSKAMVGMGSPFWSPSPYHALCAGVPFINPVLSFDSNDRWNKSKWSYSQHPTLEQYDPPFVYHVHKQNYTGFVEALKAATSTPIPSFIPDHMTEKAVRERVRFLMEHDWKEEARVVLEERKSTGMGYIFELE